MNNNYSDIIPKVFIPTDFSQICNDALCFALDFCRVYNCECEIFHAESKDLYLSTDSKFTLDTALLYKTRFGLKINFVTVECDDVCSTIVNRIKDSMCGFVVLGTHGKVGLQRLTGSYTFDIVSKVDIPVIVVQNKIFHKVSKIILPVSFGYCKSYNYLQAAALAKFFNASVFIIPRFENRDARLQTIMASVKEMKRVFDLYNVEYVDKVSSSAGGNFARQVLKYSEEQNVDVIMVSTQGSNLPQLDSWSDQFIFNIQQIPAVCIQPLA